jgi:hypothetical protein
LPKNRENSTNSCHKFVQFNTIFYKIKRKYYIFLSRPAQGESSLSAGEGESVGVGGDES